MADIKPEPVIDYADGYPHWVLDGDNTYGVLPQPMIAEALDLAKRGRALSDWEEAQGMDVEIGEELGEVEDSWESLDDARAELVYRIAEMFGLEES